LKALALFSGGLDSILAAKLIQRQGIDVECITFETPFFSADKARDGAARAGLILHVLDITEDHLIMLRSPRYGYGKNMNPCIDCHTLMLKKAGELMISMGAGVLVTGEVLGQRPMSQTKQSLHVVAKNSGYQDYIIRPLSAKLLPVTKAELEGLVDREQLWDIQGRGRHRQMEAAAAFGIREYPAPAGGCLLTDVMFSKRLKELFAHDDFTLSSIHLLKTGRHFRINDRIKVIVGRHQRDNALMEEYAKSSDIMLHTAHFPGPATLIPGNASPEELKIAASLCVLYSDAPKNQPVKVNVFQDKAILSVIEARAEEKDQAAQWII
jgi:tRNA U34 2-thiouridine synthase MnmA/TrmU